MVVSPSVCMRYSVSMAAPILIGSCTLFTFGSALSSVSVPAAAILSVQSRGADVSADVSKKLMVMTTTESSGQSMFVQDRKVSVRSNKPESNIVCLNVVCISFMFSVMERKMRQREKSNFLFDMIIVAAGRISADEITNETREK